MFKAIKFALLAIVLIVILAAVIVYFSLNSIVASAIRSVGTKATGTSVQVQSVNLKPFSGILEIKGLNVANPKDYQSDNAFAFNRFYVSMDVKSVFSDKIVVNEILIDKVAIDFEPALTKGTSNLQEINKNIAAFSATSEKKQEETKKEGKKVAIKHLLLTDATISISSSMLKQTVKAQMPKFELKDIGEQGDKSPVEVFQDIYTQLLQGVMATASSSAGINLDALGKIGDIPTTPEGVTKKLGEGLKALGF